MPFFEQLSVGACTARYEIPASVGAPVQSHTRASHRPEGIVEGGAAQYRTAFGTYKLGK